LHAKEVIGLGISMAQHLAMPLSFPISDNEYVLNQQNYYTFLKFLLCPFK